MINRGSTYKSQYIFNSKTGNLEKKEKNVQTIASLSKQLNKKTNNLEKIGEAVNKASEQPINQITLITSEDNLVHNYFYDFEYSWDATECLSVATIKMPKLNADNVNYWATYQGTVTVYGGYNLETDVATNSNNTEQQTTNALAEFGISSDIKPFFRGTVSRIKEYQTYIVLYIDNIGLRFKQKIPDQFRQSYINNQNVRDAFQAICEFLGVQFICPPQNTNTTTTNQVSTNGKENDVSNQEQKLKNLAEAAKNQIGDTKNDTNNNTSNTNQQDILSNNQSSTNQNTNTSTSNNTANTNSSTTNTQQINDVQLNGFADINFDANGAIVHGTTTIETSPDMADTLVEIEENPLEKYIEDETGIAEKVQKFLDGDMFEELHNQIMDYGAITIQPKSTTTSNISSISSTASNNNNGNEENGNEENGEDEQSGGHINHSTNTQYLPSGMGKTQYGTLYLTKDYINNLSPEAAHSLYIKGKKNNTYTADTMSKLLQRSFHLKLF